MIPSPSPSSEKAKPLPFWLYPVAALAYFATFRLGLWSIHTGELVAPLWLATGLGIWLVARFGSRMVFAIALGEFAANWLAGEPVKGTPALLVLIAIISGNGLTALFGAWLWRSARERWQGSLGDFCKPVAGFLAAFAAPLVSATIGVGALVLAGRTSPAEMARVWFGWWTGNAIGSLFFLPLLFAAPKLWLQLRSASSRDLVRGALLLAVSVGAAWLIFGQPGGGMYLFVLLPGLLLATAWLGAPGAHLLAFALFATGMIAGSRGQGSFVSGLLPDRALNLQLFLSALALVALLLPVFHARRSLLQRLPLALLFGGWALGGLFFAQLQRQQERVDASDFAQLTAKVQADIQNKLSTSVAALRSGESLLLASQSVERAEWDTFVTSLKLTERYPGIRGIGLINAVRPADQEKFLESVRADGAPNFLIHPLPGKTTNPGEELFVLTYLSPSYGDKSVLGLDLGSELMLRRTIETARDTGEPRLTDQIALLQDQTHQPGFIIFLPLYKKDAPVATVAERRAALRAWIEAPFSTERLFSGVLGEQTAQLNLHVFAGTQADTSQLVFATEPQAARLPQFVQVTTLNFAGKTFTLGWSYGPAFALSSRLPLIWFAVSFALGAVLLVGWIQSLQIFREQADALVTERTAELKMSENLLLLTGEMAQVGGWELDLRTKKLIWSRETYRIHEIDPPVTPSLAEAINFYTPEARPLIAAAVQAAVDHGTPYHLALPIITAKGRARWVQTQGAVVRENGQSIRLYGTIQDITERKQVETMLRNEQVRIRTILDTVADPLFVKDNEHRIILANQAYYDLFQLDEKTVIGYTVMEKFSAEERQLYLEVDRRVLDTGITDIREETATVKGVTLHIVTRKARFIEHSGDRFLVCSIHNITDRKLAEKERERFEHKLQETQKLESLGVLAGGIAHDFNNLLTGILGNASLASMELPASSPMQTYLESIKQGSLRAADLCRQMLAYSGKGRFVIKNLSLNRLVEETTHLLELSISKKSVLRFHLHPELPAIEGDGTQLRQVIMNLVINASEAIGDKSGVISLNTGLTRVDRAYLGGTILAPELPDGTYVYLEVSDSGCGMSPETQAKIFDPFFTTKFTGRGLGLAAVLGIVRGHKGALKIYSEAGRGTTFKLLFPCAVGAEELLAVDTPAKSRWRGQGCVLVVDDEESIRTTAALMLQRLGFSVALAADGREAVAVFQAEPQRFNLVLMDLTMPHLDGEQAFTELRRIRPDVPVVLMSGFNEQEAIARFTGKGLAHFLQKPFPFDGLSKVVQAVLDRQ